MTRSQRYYLGHFLAYLPLGLTGIYTGFVQLNGYDRWLIPWLVIPSMICFVVGLIIRDKPENSD